MAAAEGRTSAGAARPAPLADALAEPARREAESLALVGGSQRLSHGELQAQAERLACRLAALGAGPEERVGLLFEEPWEAWVALRGVIASGAAFVPLDPAWPRERLAFVLGDAGARQVLTSAKLAGRVAEAGAAPVLAVEEAAPAVRGAVRRGQPSNLAYVLYTSGSTGRPKGVAVEQAALLGHARAMIARSALTATDRVLQFASLGFDVALEEALPTWLAGAAVICAPALARASVEELDRCLRAEAVSVVNLPAAYWHHWVDELERTGGRLPPKLRLVLTGSEPVSLRQLRRWLRLPGAPPVVNAYGLTETTITSTAFGPETDGEAWPEAPLMPIGRPLDNTSAYVVGPDMQVLPVGEPGELYLGGSGLARGYLGDPVRTAQAFVPDPFAPTPGTRLFRTGDLARRLPDGSLEWLGRTDRQLKLRGRRIDPGEIEAALATHPAVREAAVVRVTEADGSERLAACVVMDGSADLEPTRMLRGHLRRRFPAAMVPTSFARLEELPRQANGKLDPAALERLALTARPPAPAAARVRTPTEAQLARLWARVLQIDDVAPADDFFELGGHSLAVLSMREDIRAAFGVELPVRCLFPSAVLADVAARIDELRRDGRQAPALLVTLQPRGRGPAVFCVDGSGGEGLRYRHLAGALGEDRPVHAVPSATLEHDLGAPDVGGLARRLLDVLQQMQPHGPYHLLSWSLAGLVAFEAARQLRHAGQPSGALVLLDSAPPGAPVYAWQPEMELWWAFLADLVRGSSRVEPATLPGLLSLVAARAAAGAPVGEVPPDLGLDVPGPELRRLFAGYQTWRRAAGQYRPAPVALPLLLLQPESTTLTARERVEAGWRTLCGAQLRAAAVPGTHTRLLEPPGAARVAAQVVAEIERHERRPASRA